VTEKIKIDNEKLKRTRVKEEEQEPESKPTPVSAGAVEKGMDLAFNPTREKMPEVTIINPMQGRLFPILNLVDLGLQGCLEKAQYREDKEKYAVIHKKLKPVSPNYIDELLYRTAQWQKSIEGRNLTKICDIALAEVETEAGEKEGLSGGTDVWDTDK